MGLCLRVARPTNDIKKLLAFYCDGLGFKIIYEFRDHEGFDGIMLGKKTCDYHLEFTHKREHDAGRAPTQDNLLVFYIPNRIEWEQAIQQMLNVGYEPLKSLILTGICTGRLSRILMDTELFYNKLYGLLNRYKSNFKLKLGN